MDLKGNALWAALFAAVHLGLALLYANVTPFETAGVLRFQRATPSIDIGAPDELQHVVYVRRLARGDGFPVLDPKDPDLGRNYQSHQPPAYYLLAAGWSKLFGDSAMGLRSLNALVGACTVLGVYFLAWWGFRRREIAAGAAGFAALLPMNIALSGAVSNDPLLFCLCTWSLALVALGMRDGICVKRGLLIGLLVGLAFLTKTTALALVPAILIGLALAAPKPKVGALLPGMALALVLGGLWWGRNQSLYGDPFAMKVFNVAFTGSPKAGDFIGALGSQTYWFEMVGWWTARSFLGVFGYMDIFLPVNLYFIAIPLLVLFALIGSLAALRRAPEEDDGRAVNLMNLAFFLVVLALFVQFNKTYFQGQARYLFPAIGPISIAIVWGAASLWKSRPAVPIGALLACLLALNAFVLSWLPSEFRQRVVQTEPARHASNR